MMMMAVISFVLALFLVDAAATVKGPAIAMSCGRTNMYHNMDTGRWAPDVNGTSCITDETRILQYCRQLYPDDDITSISLGTDSIAIAQWCKEGKSSHCRGHTRSVQPYYCKSSKVENKLASDLVASGCKSLQQKVKCHTQEFWKNYGNSQCKKKGMKLIDSQTVQKACSSKSGADLYHAVQLVCCPMDYQEPIDQNEFTKSIGAELPMLGLGPVVVDEDSKGVLTAVDATKPDTTTTLTPKTTIPTTSESLDVEICRLTPVPGDCRALITAWYFDAATSSCNVFHYGGCGGNDNRFNTQEECMQSCQHLVDRCHRPKLVGMCRASFKRWHFNTASGKCEKFVYGGCGDNGNNFMSKQDCQQTCENKPAKTQKATTTTSFSEEEEVVTKTTTVMTDSESDILSLTPQLQQQIDEENNRYKIARDNEIKKYNQYIVNNEVDKEELNALNINHHRSMQAVEDLHQVKFDDLMAQARTLTYDQFRSQVDTDSPNIEELVFSLQQYVNSEEMDQKHCLEHYNTLMNDYLELGRTKEISESASQTIQVLQERVNNIQDRLKNNVLNIREEVRVQIQEDIENAMQRVQPVQFKTIETIDELDIYEQFDDYPQSSGSSDIDETETIFIDDEEVQLDQETHMEEVRNYDEDVTVSQSQFSLPLWMFWTVMFMIAALAIIFVVRITMVRRRRGLKGGAYADDHQKVRTSTVYTQVNKTLTPEERQLLQMQQNGFENPTYKFFEKNQVA